MMPSNHALKNPERSAGRAVFVKYDSCNWAVCRCGVTVKGAKGKMASFNRVVLLGNLTHDIKLEKTPQGTPVADVGLAVNDRVKKNGEWTDEATFVDIILWGRLAEVAAEYLSKGSSILIEGRLKLDSWENKEGQKRSKLRVVAERMQMLGGRSTGGGSGGSPGSSYGGASSSGDSVVEESMPDDEIPF